MHVHADTPSALAEEFPGWHVWRSQEEQNTPKGWYATREQPLSSMEYRQGLYRTLASDDPDGLRTQLEQQARREERRP